MVEEEMLKKANSLIREEGERNSGLMHRFPTALESSLIKILDEGNIKYKFQKLFYRYMKGYRKYVDAYYIANFWIPKKKLILEVQQGKRKVRMSSEDFRVYSNTGISPVAQVLKIGEEDYNCPTFKEELLSLLR